MAGTSKAVGTVRYRQRHRYEFYPSVLQLRPDSQTAQEALRESFPEAAARIEHAINRQALDEARREIGLLRESDSNNFTLAPARQQTVCRARCDDAPAEAQTEAERIQKAAHTTRT